MPSIVNGSQLSAERTKFQDRTSNVKPRDVNLSSPHSSSSTNHANTPNPSMKDDDSTKTNRQRAGMNASLGSFDHMETGKTFPRLSIPVELMRHQYDVVVIGSGYGGGVAASRMARGGQAVCLLELGKEKWRKLIHIPHLV